MGAGDAGKLAGRGAGVMEGRGAVWLGITDADGSGADAGMGGALGIATGSDDAGDSGIGEVITPPQIGHGPVVGGRSLGIRILPLQ